MNLFSWFGKENKPFKAEYHAPAFTVEKKHKGRIGLVLGGGGSFGRFEVTVLKYMNDVGLLQNVDVIVGTSVGGLTALFVAKFWGEFDKVLDIWTTRVIKNSDIYDGEVPSNFAGIVGRLGGFLCGDKKSLLKPRGLYNLLKVHLGDTVFTDLPIPTYITATDIRNKNRFIFSADETPLVSCQLAGQSTSAIPVIFPHVRWFDKVLADGGIQNNNPVSVATELGKCDKIILIGCTPNDMPEADVKDDMVDDGVNALATALHLAEEDNWNIVEAKKIPLIEIFPSDMTKMGKSILDFSNMEALQYGNDVCFKYLTEQKVKDFLMK